MTAEAGGDSALDMAARRLERAVTLLEQRLRDRPAQADADVDQDRARLAAELDAARAREKALEAAGAEASEALGRAIAQIRSALTPENEDEG